MPTIDQEKLYPNWTRNQKLQEDLTRKYLDAPNGEMQITNTTNTGISGGKILAGILGGTGMASIAACVIAWMLSGSTVPQQPAQIPQDSAYSVDFYDQYGEPIYVAPVDKP